MYLHTSNGAHASKNNIPETAGWDLFSGCISTHWEACRWGSGCKRLRSHNIPHTHWLPETSDGKTTYQFVCSQQKPFYQPHWLLTTRSHNNHSCLECVPHGGGFSGQEQQIRSFYTPSSLSSQTLSHPPEKWEGLADVISTHERLTNQIILFYFETAATQRLQAVNYKC